MHLKPDFIGSLITRGLLAFTFLALSGCVSSMVHGKEWSGSKDISNSSMVYAGTCSSFLLIYSHGHGDSRAELSAIAAFYDLPATVVMDTVLLPVDLISDAIASNKDAMGTSACSVLTGS